MAQIVERARAARASRAWAAAGGLALVGASLALRAPGVGRHLWMDEGIAVGIAGHPLSQIPGLLRLDGSPPLYYVLLHLWMGVAGASDVAVHWLSVVFATLCVPAAWWAGTRVGGRRAGWILAALLACCAFLTSHGAEARMYPLVILLGLLCVGCFVGAYVHGERAYLLPFGVTLALSLYAHNWALFVAAALAAVAMLTRPRDVPVGFGVAALLYAPWLPTLLFQARHTGAPWATSPPLGALVSAPESVLGGEPAMVVVLLAAAAGVVASRAGVRLAVVGVAPILVAWGASQISPAWDPRYLAVVVAPVLMLAAAGLAHTGRLGIAALAVLAVLWVPGGGPVAGSDAFQLARAASPRMRAGDLVVVTAFAQLPVVARYLPAGVRYATPLGGVRDPHVVDWRDARERFARASMSSALLDRVSVGSRVLLVVPVVWDDRSARTALGREERRLSSEHEQALLHDRRFSLLATVPQRFPRLPPAWMLTGFLLRKNHAR